MFKPEELRLGNFVKNESGVWKVVSLQSEYSKSYSYPQSISVIPIGHDSTFPGPLTLSGIELTKMHIQHCFGRDLYEGNSEHTEVYNFFHSPFSRIVVKTNGLVRAVNDEGVGVELPFFHNLQNLYFVLANEELEFPF